MKKGEKRSSQVEEGRFRRLKTAGEVEGRVERLLRRKKV